MSQQQVSRGECNNGSKGSARQDGPAADDRPSPPQLLQDRLRFEALLARLSATFIHLPADEVDGQIERALRQIVDFLGIERSSLAQFSADGREFLVTHSYTAPGVSPLARMDLAALWPWYTAEIRRGEVLRFTRLPDELPAEAVREREYYAREGGPRSHLAVPFRVGKAVLGAIGFGSFRREVAWPDELARGLQLVGEVFANALGRKWADLALRESERRFRLLSDAAPVLVWMSGPDKGCTYFNKPWLDFTGRPLGRELGDGWSEGVHPDDRERCLGTYTRAFDARQAFRMEYRLRRSDGEYRWVLDTGVPRFEADGTFEGYVGSAIDVTDQKRAEEKEAHLREQLVRAGRVTLLGELAASIAHEVNQPLCAIVSNAETAQRLLAGGGPEVGEVREALEDITQDGRRASAVIARIRASLRQGPVERAPVDLNETLREVAALTRRRLAGRGLAVKLDLAEGLPPVLGDRVQLQQVVVNLLTNGADAAEAAAGGPRELVLRSAADGAGGVAVAVEDAGAGIEPGSRERVFDPFFTTKPGGMGMGLAICKSIVEGHGGRIAAAANPGGGTTVRFTLPVLPGGAS
jgi:PAS domain S-box-containing protein